MAANTVAIKKDVDGKPIPQHYNTITNQYEVSEGVLGIQQVILCDGEGNPLNINNINNNIDIAINNVIAKLDELIEVVK